MLQNDSTTVVNKTNTSLEQEKDENSYLENAPLTCSYLVVILIGIIGNSLVISAVRRNRSMRSTTNILLAFVAVADFTSLICFIPFAFLLTFRLPGGTLGAVLCWTFATANTAAVTIVISITTLTLIAIERYHALVKPLNNRLRLNKENVHYWIFGISLYAFALIIPLFFFTVYDERQRICSIKQINGKRIYFSLFGFGVALALFVICFCYWRIIRGFYFGNQKVCENEDLLHKRKVVKLLLLVTLAFIICFTPRGVYFLFYSSDRGPFNRVSLFLLHCNSATNPVILGFQSQNFRSEFNNIVSGINYRIKRFICFAVD